MSIILIGRGGQFIVNLASFSLFLRVVSLGYVRGRLVWKFRSVKLPYLKGQEDGTLSWS